MSDHREAACSQCGAVTKNDAATDHPGLCCDCFEVAYGQLSPAEIGRWADTIRAPAIARAERAEDALRAIAANLCGIPGHAVAVGCGSSVIAARALAAIDTVLEQVLP